MQFKDFVGYPYDREKLEEHSRLDDAIKVVNDWLSKNEQVTVVNMESIYSNQSSMMGSTEPKFKNLRVWYTEPQSKGIRLSSSQSGVAKLALTSFLISLEKEPNENTISLIEAAKETIEVLGA